MPIKMNNMISENSVGYLQLSPYIGIERIKIKLYLVFRINFLHLQVHKGKDIENRTESLLSYCRFEKPMNKLVRKLLNKYS